MQALGLENEHPFLSLLFLFFANILFRLLSTLVLSTRIQRKDQLVQIDAS